MIDKKIVILGGGEAQIGLIRTAKSLGIYTVVVGTEGDYPGYVIADKYITANILDKEGIVDVVRQEKADGIALCCSDIGLSTLGYVCDQTGLTGISYSSAILSSNKLEMKQAFEKCQVNTAKFRRIHLNDNYIDSVSNLKFPIILKAVNLQGSKGIYICNTPSEVPEYIAKVFVASGLDYCIAEEFLVGIEFGAQAFIYNGEIVFMIPHGDRTVHVNGSNIPIEHYVPCDAFPPTLLQKVREQINNAIKALGFNNCAVNVDLIIKDEKPYIIELSGRAGANMLPELISEYLGLDYYEMILRAALNDDPVKYYKTKCSYTHGHVLTRILYPLHDSIIHYNKNIEYDNVKPDMYVCDGDRVKGLPSLNRIGKVLVHAETIEECSMLLDRFLLETINVRTLTCDYGA